VIIAASSVVSYRWGSVDMVNSQRHVEVLKMIELEV
jgi:hypothetical protein